jgi:hypothetical protein
VVDVVVGAGTVVVVASVVGAGAFVVVVVAGAVVDVLCGRVVGTTRAVWLAIAVDDETSVVRGPQAASSSAPTSTAHA